MIKIYEDFLWKNGLKLMIKQEEIQTKKIRIKTPMLRSDLCDFSDAYIVLEGKGTANFNPRKNDYDNNSWCSFF